MSRRSIPEKKRNWLAKEVGDWQVAGLITAEQAEKILGTYETPIEESERKHSTVLLALMSVAAIFVGLGVLLLIGYNWAAMSASLKLTIISGALSGTHAAGIFLRFVRNSRLLSEVIFFFGCLLYGCGIFLVAQIFNFNAHYPDAIWWWALGVLPFALCLDTFLMHLLLIGLLAVWYGMEAIGFGRTGFLFWGDTGSVPRGVFSLPLLSLPGIAWAYRNRSVTTVSLYAVLLAWWVILTPVALQMEEESIYWIGAAGGLFLVCAECHQAGAHFAIPYRIMGVSLAGGTLYMLSFYRLALELAQAKLTGKILVLLGLITFLALALLGGSYLLRASDQEASESTRQRLAALIRRTVLPASVVLSMFLFFFFHAAAREALLSTVLANTILVILAVWLIKIGLREDRFLPFAGGVVVLLAWSLGRYIDLFGDFGGMLGAALMFLLCGVMMFGLAYFWRRRKELSHVN